MAGSRTVLWIGSDYSVGLWPVGQFLVVGSLVMSSLVGFSSLISVQELASVWRLVSNRWFWRLQKMHSVCMFSLHDSHLTTFHIQHEESIKMRDFGLYIIFILISLYISFFVLVCYLQNYSIYEFASRTNFSICCLFKELDFTLPSKIHHRRCEVNKITNVDKSKARKLQKTNFCMNSMRLF